MTQKIMYPVTFLALVICLMLGGNGWSSESANATFSGLVLDVDKKPVAGAAVYVYNSSNVRRPADYIAPVTDVNGLFRLTLPAGLYWTVVRIRRGSVKYGPLQPGDRHSGAPLEIDIMPGEDLKKEFVVADLEETSRLAVKYDTHFLRIKGVLLTEKGEPVENGYAFANRSPAAKRIPDYISAGTDSNGEYVLFMPPGTYYFGLARKFPPGSASMNFQKVTIDKNTKDINIVIAE